VETGCQGGQGSPRAVAPSEEEEEEDRFGVFDDVLIRTMALRVDYCLPWNNLFYSECLNNR
jgi:hypothetical protein